MATKTRKKPALDTLSGVIAARIKGLGLTNYAAGKMSGIDAASILRFLNGERSLTLKTAAKLCEALDLVLVIKPSSTLSLDLVRQREERRV